MYTKTDLRFSQLPRPYIHKTWYTAMRIIVAASGGVAALKTPSLVRRLQEAGHEVRVAATDDALHFVTKLSLAVAAGGAVFDREAWFAADGQARHIDWARWADALLVAPATADALASASTGRGDDVISALILAGVPKVIWAPAMNTEMWRHAAVQHNVETLRTFGHQFVGPAEGKLAAKGEGEGTGRMVEPEEIVAQLAHLFKRDLEKHHVLVSAGPTREYLDPVRFISNPSSGRMGYALAEAAAARGAKVTLVSGPTALDAPVGVQRLEVESAEEMLDALSAHFSDASMLIMSAAVADWRAADIATEKKAKTGEEQTLALRRTPDILENLSKRKRKQIMVGFAMETHQGVERAADKAKRKKLEFICLNYPTQENTAFGGDTNQVTIVTADAQAEELPLMSKRDLADVILDRALSIYEGRSSE